MGFSDEWARGAGDSEGAKINSCFVDLCGLNAGGYSSSSWTGMDEDEPPHYCNFDVHSSGPRAAIDRGNVVNRGHPRTTNSTRT